MTDLSHTESHLRGENIQLSTHFHLREFECGCGTCPTTLVTLAHVEMLEKLRAVLGRAITITSGFRCAAYNRQVGGATRSQHVVGTATDIVITGVDPDDVADLCEDFDGLGRYETFTHIDSRGQRARWDKRGRE